MKFGGDFRKVGADFFSPGDGSGFFNFDKAFTSADPRSDGTATSGSSVASFMLGYPTGDPTNLSTMPLSTPLNVFSKYYAGYVQDDWRVRPNFTLNYGLRIEHEDGIREQQNRITVGFDPNAVSPVNVTIPADPVAGTAARQVKGGLMYAGAERRERLPGQSAEGEVVAARRRRVLLRQQDGASRRIRHLLGAVEFPAAEHDVEQLRPDGVHAEHADAAEPVHSHGDARQPVPERSGPAGGQRAGAAGRRRDDHPLRRSEQGRTAGAAVLRGFAA